MEKNSKFVILYESVKSKVDFLSNADNTLDGKAGTLMGFEITLGIGYLSLVLGTLEGIKFYEGVFGLILLGISTTLLLFLTRPKVYFTISVNPDEHSEYLEKPEEDLLLQLISDAQYAFSENNKTLNRKPEFNS